MRQFAAKNYFKSYNHVGRTGYGTSHDICYVFIIFAMFIVTNNIETLSVTIGKNPEH